VAAGKGGVGRDRASGFGFETDEVAFDHPQSALSSARRKGLWSVAKRLMSAVRSALAAPRTPTISCNASIASEAGTVSAGSPAASAIRNRKDRLKGRHAGQTGRSRCVPDSWLPAYLIEFTRAFPRSQFFPDNLPTTASS
ncbi:hypothetical protein, partial [Mesorhizobium sp.]|uniref:hypothetical protein n=1 Tax=Mesorhizobium sp. TaxID=1871066 RepID=UPI00257DEEE8